MAIFIWFVFLELNSIALKRKYKLYCANGFIVIVEFVNVYELNKTFISSHHNILTIYTERSMWENRFLSGDWTNLVLLDNFNELNFVYFHIVLKWNCCIVWQFILIDSEKYTREQWVNFCANWLIEQDLITIR